MKALIFFLLLPLLYLVSILPFPLLYLKSDFLFLLCFYVVRYRRKTVHNNIRNSFPGKTVEERKALEKRFYRFFCDMIVESVKGLTISREVLMKRCTYANPEIYSRYHTRGKSMFVVMGHFGNWEWAGLRSSLEPNYVFQYIYLQLSNKWFDKLVRKMRERFGAEAVPMEGIYKKLLSDAGRLTATAFIADQSPAREGAVWVTFMNQQTAFSAGVEKIAAKLNCPVVFGSVRRQRRGYYKIELELLSENPAALPEGKLTEMHVRKLEEDILASPETWLWTHKRWKLGRS